MHCKVLEFEVNKDVLYNTDIPEWFCPGIADYYDKLEPKEREECAADFLKSFQELGFPVDLNRKSVTFTKPGIEKFFADDFSKFKKISAQISLSDFSAKQTDVYMLETLLDDRFGHYVTSSYGGLETLSSFLRDLYGYRIEHEGTGTELTLCIGDIYDYHW